MFTPRNGGRWQLVSLLEILRYYLLNVLIRLDMILFTIPLGCIIFSYSIFPCCLDYFFRQIRIGPPRFVCSSVIYPQLGCAKNKKVKPSSLFFSDNITS